MTDPSSGGEASTSEDLREAIQHLIDVIDDADGREGTAELRRVAQAHLGDDGPSSPAGSGSGPGREGDEGDDHHNPAEVLRDALHRFETDHPDLTAAINNVSHYLSGLGI
jgi:hypothetical protein